MQRGSPGRQQQGTLAEIVQQQAGQDHAEPGDADRPLADVAHVGIERLGAGHGQKDGAQHEEADEPWWTRKAMP